MSIELNEIRKRIDSIDEQIVALLNRRAAEVQRIALFKSANGMPAIDPDREEDVYRRIVGENAGAIDDEALKRIFAQILAESRKMQMKTIEKCPAHAETIQ
jgi:chorismate mutase